MTGETQDDRAASDASTAAIDPGVGFQGAVSVSLGATATGVASLTLIAAGASSGALLSTVPGVTTVGLVVGALAAWARPGVAARLGAWRWRTVAATLPAAGIGFVTLGLFLFGDGSPEWHLVPPGVAAFAGTLAGRTAAAIAHDAYVESVTADGSPGVSWTLKKTWRSTRIDHELRAYEAGLVVDPPSSLALSHRRLLPWAQFTGIRLTPVELVLERRWRPSIRCDRSAIDDAEAIEDALRPYVASNSTVKRDRAASE